MVAKSMQEKKVLTKLVELLTILLRKTEKSKNNNNCDARDSITHGQEQQMAKKKAKKVVKKAKKTAKKATKKKKKQIVL